jgi:capsular polysaccharide biosynthesis protein
MTRVFPRVGTALIERGRVLTRTGAVIGPDDRLIADVSSTFMAGNPAAHPIFLTAKLPRVTKIEETVAVLTTYRSNIYYHWLLDTLPRLQLLEESGFSYERIVVPGQTRFQKESLELLGLDSHRLITDANLHLEAAALAIPSLPAVSGNQPRWACDFLRKSFLKHLPRDVPARRRIYVSRQKGGTRHLVNEPDLLPMLEKRGFERVFLEERPFLEQVRLFNEAEIVVSTHGSGLANLVFCRPGTAVVELFSPNYMNVMYWALSDRVGLTYYFLKGEGDVSRERGRRVHEDLLIDVLKVAKLLDQVEQSLPLALLPAASALG